MRSNMVTTRRLRQRAEKVLSRPLLFLLLAGSGISTTLSAQESAVEVRHSRENKQVEVSIAGKPFTVYRYGSEYPQKPIFYPILSAAGNMINRGFPMRTDIPGERQDHPHQQSLFFAYGNVNGADFWSSRDGERIVHRAVLDVSSGQVGHLEVLLDWVDSEGQVLLQEVKRVTFGHTGDARWMDHDLTLTALSRPLFFNDTKEGAFAIRVAPSLREEEGTGRYLNAYGWETTGQVWGKRSPWVALHGSVQDEEVTLAIFDHPSTENYPSYWHARGYGLFAANAFGRKDFAAGAAPINKKLEPHESFHFRYRVILYEGKVSKERLDRDYSEYIQ